MVALPASPSPAGRQQLVEERTAGDHAAAVHVRFPNEIGDDVTMRCGDVMTLAWVFGEVEKERRGVVDAGLTGVVSAACGEMWLVNFFVDGPPVLGTPIVNGRPPAR